MSDCLLIMNGRHIDVCLDSYKKLTTDKMYFTGFSEKQLEGPINRFVEQTDYENYIIFSDDEVIRQETVDMVRKGLESHDVVTGYCEIPGGHVNLCDKPLRGAVPRMSSYSWMKLSDVEAYPEPFVPTTFAGFFLTGMSRKLWLEFPFRAYGALPKSFVSPFLVRHLHDYGVVSQMIKGFSSDYNLCRRLAKKGVKIHAAKGALIEHIGGTAWGKRIPLIIGSVKPSARLVHI